MENGECAFDILIKELDPETTSFCLDTYWIHKGGCDPASMIREFAGRIPCIHLKDYSYGASMEVVGEGNLFVQMKMENKKSHLLNCKCDTFVNITSPTQLQDGTTYDSINIIHHTPYREKQRKSDADTTYSGEYTGQHKNARLSIYKEQDIGKNAQKSL